MKNAFQKSPSTATAAIFLVMLAIGHVFWGWGAFSTAFCLLLYCIVAVAIKLDDVAQRLAGLSEQLERLGTHPASDAAAVQPTTAAPMTSPDDTGSAGGPDASDEI